ncbi:alpha/beta hydrolase [Loktanella sp. 5RATIMAR09]|uniref:alpha/beta hydrolase fold domain-containing protein n=1 Tax=Loktanella sp. 5RATIMAR09 TaxID=1225655 RepID=UPI0006EB5ED6|nr:alpha/beta hydrolase [Loktanella sp. 5RATIMAR09]
MISRQQKFWNAYARLVQKPVIALIRHQPTVRRIADLSAAITLKTPIDLQLAEKIMAFGSDTVRTTICQIGPAPTAGSMLYLHGGAFMIGNLQGYRHLVASLGKAANQQAHFLHYALSPEQSFPKALDQATVAYQALCADPEAGPISLVGDSAGGNLVFALLHRICRRGLQQPAAVVGISPIVDMRMTNESLKANSKSDHLVPLSWVVRGKNAYLAGHDPSDPEVSPVLGTFVGASPCLIHADSTEILFDDAKAIAARLREQGVTTEFVTFTGRSHVWHLNVGRSPEADSSVAEIGAFVQRHCYTQLTQ